MIIISHNIRSLHNLGAIFRSADAFGIEKIYLTGYTATPPRKEINKTALGSENIVPWEKQDDIFIVIKELKEKNYKVIGLETGAMAQPLNDFLLEGKKLALVLGNEVTGIENEVRDNLDGLVEIPMPGHKKSLNVSVAASIAMFVFRLKK